MYIEDISLNIQFSMLIIKHGYQLIISIVIKN